MFDLKGMIVPAASLLDKTTRFFKGGNKTPVEVEAMVGTVIDTLLGVVNTKTNTQVTPSAINHIKSVVNRQITESLFSKDDSSPLSVAALVAEIGQLSHGHAMLEVPECACSHCSEIFDPRDIIVAHGKRASVVHLDTEKVADVLFDDPEGNFTGRLGDVSIDA